MTPKTHQNPAMGISFVLFGVLSISFNDMLVKQLSGGYPLHQTVFIRSFVGILFSFVLLYYEGGLRLLHTSRPLLHGARALLVVMANLMFFTALASLPLAEVTAIFFAAPLIITLLGIPVLGEKVGPLRLVAVLVGFVGVIIMVRPWESGDQRAAASYVYLLPLGAAFSYAVFQILTRKLGAQTKASAMAIYVQMMFLFVCAGFWLSAGDGRYIEGLENQSLIFLLRAWSWPQGNDIYLFAALGINSAIVSYTITQAYRLADAATIAPFEYIGLPLAVFWGWLIWAELPNLPVVIGIVLILGSGLFVYLRERQRNRTLVSTQRVRRRY